MKLSEIIKEDVSSFNDKKIQTLAKAEERTNHGVATYGGDDGYTIAFKMEPVITGAEGDVANAVYSIANLKAAEGKHITADYVKEIHDQYVAGRISPQVINLAKQLVDYVIDNQGGTDYPTADQTGAGSKGDTISFPDLEKLIHKATPNAKQLIQQLDDYYESIAQGSFPNDSIKPLAVVNDLFRKYKVNIQIHGLDTWDDYAVITKRPTLSAV